MTDRPLAILAPTIGNVVSGRCTRLRRPGDGALAKLEPGDRLWLREGYYLNKKYDSLRPTSALQQGASPMFERDLGGRPKPDGLGIHRAARLLKREWHRAHLVVEEVEFQRLQEITDREVVAEGFATRGAWAQAWDRGVEWFDKRRAWSNNPTVVVFGFRYVPAALPLPPAKAATPGARRGPRQGRAAADHARRAEFRRQLDAPRPEPVELLEIPAADGDRTWCDQCQRRVTGDEGRACDSPFCPIDPPSQEREAA